MNEWGIPDWRDPAAYGDVTHWTFNRWRWEFLRRRDDLRQEFDRLAAIQHERDIRQFSIERTRGGATTFPFGRVLSPNEAGFYVSPERIVAGRPGALPNPRIGNQPELVIEHHDGPEVLHYFAAAQVPEGFERIDFDLSKPLAPQLKAAKDLLSKAQSDWQGKPIQKRRHPVKWLTYLRVLDARAEGASWAVIAAILKQTAGTEQTARDTWEQARALCFNF